MEGKSKERVLSNFKFLNSLIDLNCMPSACKLIYVKHKHKDISLLKVI